MVDVEKASRSIGKLTLLKFFPSDRDARLALVEMICGMAESNEQIDWFCKRVLQVFNEYPGPQELRSLFSNRYRPADGISASSVLYAASGFPPDPEVERLKLPEPEMPKLPEGHKISCDINIENAVIMLGDQKKMQPARDYTRRRRTPAEIDEILGRL